MFDLFVGALVVFATARLLLAVGRHRYTWRLVLIVALLIALFL